MKQLFFSPRQSDQSNTTFSSWSTFRCAKHPETPFETKRRQFSAIRETNNAAEQAGNKRERGRKQRQQKTSSSKPTFKLTWKRKYWGLNATRLALPQFCWKWWSMKSNSVFWGAVGYYWWLECFFEVQCNILYTWTHLNIHFDILWDFQRTLNTTWKYW